MSPINLTDTNDPHHSLLYKPQNTDETDQIIAKCNQEFDTSDKILETSDELPKKEKVYWWGKSKYQTKNSW